MRLKNEVFFKLSIVYLLASLRSINSVLRPRLSQIKDGVDAVFVVFVETIASHRRCSRQKLRGERKKWDLG